MAATTAGEGDGTINVAISWKQLSCRPRTDRSFPASSQLSREREMSNSRKVLEEPYRLSRYDSRSHLTSHLCGKGAQCKAAFFTPFGAALFTRSPTRRISAHIHGPNLSTIYGYCKRLRGRSNRTAVARILTHHLNADHVLLKHSSESFAFSAGDRRTLSRPNVFFFFFHPIGFFGYLEKVASRIVFLLSFQTCSARQRI